MLGLLGHIGLGLGQPFAQDTRVPHSRRRRALLFAVDTLRVFAQRHLHSGGEANEHVVDRTSTRLHNRGLTSHQIARPGTGVDGGDAGLSQVLEGLVFGVNGIDGAEVRHDGIGHLVAIGMIPSHAIGKHAGMAMGVDHARNDVLAGDIKNVRIGRNLHFGSHSRDLSAFDQNGPVGDGLLGGENGGTLDCLHADSSSRYRVVHGHCAMPSDAAMVRHRLVDRCS